MPKPDSYPSDTSERLTFEWEAYDKYYSDGNLDKPYFYHDRKREEVFVDSLIARFKIAPGSEIIDIGCGTGFYSSLLQQRSMKVTGLDRSERAIDYCKGRYGTACNWICDDAFAITRNAEFDFAFCFWFMYFNAFAYPREASQSGRRLMEYLKPNGTLFFLWHSDLTAIRLPPERFSVMNFTLEQVKEFFQGFPFEVYAIDSHAQVCSLLRRYSFNKVVTRLSCAYVYLQASSWKRARIVAVARNCPR